MALKRTLGLLAFSAAILSAPSASAAPLQEATFLPFPKEDMDELTKQGYTTEQVLEFVESLGKMPFYKDHNNPDDGDNAAWANRSIKKIFYAAVYFTASPTRPVVGASQWATQSLSVINAIDDLGDAIHFKLPEYQKLERERDAMKRDRASVEKKANEPDPKKKPTPEDRQRYDEILKSLDSEIAALQQKIDAIKALSVEAANELGSGLRAEIAQAIELKMARIGLTATTEERRLLTSSDGADISSGIAKMRSRAANLQLGLRQVVYESGLRDFERKTLAVYRRIRPDIEIRSLAPVASYVRPAAQTYLIGDGRETSSEPSMIRAVNGVGFGASAPCGALRTCSAVVEYTESGARSASNAIQGAIVMPVTFEADITFAVPPLKGHLYCNYDVGWESHGRADVRDGAMIYNGDISNRISTSSFARGGCDYKVGPGSLNDLAYYGFDEYWKKWMADFTTREQRAREDKEAYREFLTTDLENRAKAAQGRRKGSYWDSAVGWVASGRPWLAIAEVFVGTSRTFYWHTRIDDFTDSSRVNLHLDLNLENGLTRTSRFPIDGFPIVCFKKTPNTINANPDIVACPETLADEATTEAEAGNNACPSDYQYQECQKDAAATPTDATGLVTREL